MRHEIHNNNCYITTATSSASLDRRRYSVSSQIMSIGINYGHYMVTIFIGLGQRSIKKYLLFMSKKDQMADGTSRKLFMSLKLSPWGRFLRPLATQATFEVVWQTDLEVDLERRQNYCVELVALYLRRIIN